MGPHQKNRGQAVGELFNHQCTTPAQRQRLLESLCKLPKEKKIVKRAQHASTTHFGASGWNLHLVLVDLWLKLKCDKKIKGPDNPT